MHVYFLYWIPFLCNLICFLSSPIEASIAMTGNRTTEDDDFSGIVCPLSWYITAFCKATHKKHNAIDVLRKGTRVVAIAVAVKRINGNSIYVGRSVAWSVVYLTCG